MPVALTEPGWALWLGEDGSAGDPASLLGAPPDGALRIWPVRSPLGKARRNGPELLESLITVEK
jgi:putative SOS response-associated peptidase YedK